MKIPFRNVGHADHYLKTCKALLIAALPPEYRDRVPSLRLNNSLARGFDYDSHEDLKRQLKNRPYASYQRPDAKILEEALHRAFQEACQCLIESGIPLPEPREQFCKRLASRAAEALGIIETRMGTNAALCRCGSGKRFLDCCAISPDVAPGEYGASTSIAFAELSKESEHNFYYTALPILDGQTPHEAALSEHGRAQLSALLIYMEGISQFAPNKIDTQTARKKLSVPAAEIQPGISEAVGLISFPIELTVYFPHPRSPEEEETGERCAYLLMGFKARYHASFWIVSVVKTPQDGMYFSVTGTPDAIELVIRYLLSLRLLPQGVLTISDDELYPSFNTFASVLKIQSRERDAYEEQSEKEAIAQIETIFRTRNTPNPNSDGNVRYREMERSFVGMATAQGWPDKALYAARRLGYLNVINFLNAPTMDEAFRSRYDAVCREYEALASEGNAPTLPDQFSLPMNYYDALMLRQPEVIINTELDASALLSKGWKAPVYSLEQAPVKHLKSALEERAASIFADVARHRKTSFERIQWEMTHDPGQNAVLMAGLQQLEFDYQSVLNFALFGRSTFYFSDSLVERLPQADLHASVASFQLPSPSSMLIFTSQQVLTALYKAYKEAVPTDPLQIKAPVTVFLTLYPADRATPYRRLSIAGIHADFGNTYLGIVRRLALPDNWNFDQALHTDWLNLEPDHAGGGRDWDVKNDRIRSSTDESFYTDGLEFFHLILSSAVHLQQQRGQARSVKRMFPDGDIKEMNYTLVEA